MRTEVTTLCSKWISCINHESFQKATYSVAETLQESSCAAHMACSPPVKWFEIHDLNLKHFCSLCYPSLVLTNVKIKQNSKYTWEEAYLWHKHHQHTLWYTAAQRPNLPEWWTRHPQRERSKELRISQCNYTKITRVQINIKARTEHGINKRLNLLLKSWLPLPSTWAYFSMQLPFFEFYSDSQMLCKVTLADFKSVA